MSPLLLPDLFAFGLLAIGAIAIWLVVQNKRSARRASGKARTELELWCHDCGGPLPREERVNFDRCAACWNKRLSKPTPPPDAPTLSPAQAEALRLRVVNAIGAEVGVHASQVASDVLREALVIPEDVATLTVRRVEEAFDAVIGGTGFVWNQASLLRLRFRERLGLPGPADRETKP
jgi:hypothetical protein